MILLQNSQPETQIIKKNLLLWYDAYIKTSYPGSGASWSDLSGNNNTGTTQSSPTFSSNNGGYLNFNGSNQYVLRTSTSSLNTGTSRTVSVWCRPQVVPTGFVLIKLIAGNSGDYWFTFQGNSWSVRTDGGTGIVNDSATVLVNTWYNLVFTCQSGSSLKFYVNNRYIGEDTSPGNINNTNYNLHIGTYLSGNSHFNGDIAHVSIYNAILTTDEITHNYNMTKRRFGL